MDVSQTLSYRWNSSISRISITTVEPPLEATKPLLAAANKQRGAVPNLMNLVGHSPVALEGYLSLNGTLAKGKLEAKLRERMALALAEYNGSDYCLSAHDYLGSNGDKLSGDEIEVALDGRLNDVGADAALRFALHVARTHGRVSDSDLTTLRLASIDDASVIEIVVTLALNVLTNSVNNVALTDIYFYVVNVRFAAGVIAHPNPLSETFDVSKLVKINSRMKEPYEFSERH